MSQSLAKVLVHIVFSTKHWYPYLVDLNIRREMHVYLGGVCRDLDCQAPKVGGTADHIHILCILGRTVTIADLVGDLKRASSKWIKTKGRFLSRFYWQNGYGVFSVGRSEVDRIKTYIERQDEHPRKKAFQKEYRLFLEAYGVVYDERYVWD